MRKQKRKYLLSYTYEIPCYADFTVDATSKKEALAIAKKALKEGRFDNVFPEPDNEAMGRRPSVFVLDPAPEEDCYDTMEELISDGEKTP